MKFKNYALTCVRRMSIVLNYQFLYDKGPVIYHTESNCVLESNLKTMVAIGDFDAPDNAEKVDANI